MMKGMLWRKLKLKKIKRPGIRAYQATAGNL